MQPPLDSSRESVATACESVAALILCTAAIAGPLAIGGTLAWACFALEAAMGAAAILWAVARPRPLKPLLVPLAIAALGLAQLVPLPDRVLTAIAPVSAGRWKVAHEGLPEAWGRVSITPAASAAAARRLLLGVATILVVADLAREPRRRRWFYTALATSGALVWLAAVAFPVDPDNRSVYGRFSLRGPIEFWKTSLRMPMQTSGVAYLDQVMLGDQRYAADGAVCGDGMGSYIYSNHFANALCLTIPALGTMWLVTTRRRLPRAAALAGVALIFGLALWATAGWAKSRAGTASLILATAVYLSLILETRWLRWVFGGIAAAGLAVLLGFMAIFQGPLDGLASLAPAAWQPFITAAMEDVRMLAARIAGRMFLASPVLGTGLGSYGDLFPRFSDRVGVLYFAHNDHAQLWAETGIVGLLVSGWAGIVLVRRFVRFMRERRPASRMVDAAAWAALAAGAAHSVFDWNMHGPANAFLACLVAGLAFSSVVVTVRAAPGGAAAWQERVARAGFVAAIVTAVALLARDAAVEHPIARLRRAIATARLANSAEDHTAAAAELTTAITAGEAATRYAARDWPLPVLIGQARLHIDHAATQGAAVTQPEGPSAAEWFREATLASPATRGLPEPVPQKPATGTR